MSVIHDFSQMSATDLSGARCGRFSAASFSYESEALTRLLTVHSSVTLPTVRSSDDGGGRIHNGCGEDCLRMLECSSVV